MRAPRRFRQQHRGRIHRLVRRVAVPVLVVFLALTAVPDPAGAYTVEYPDPTTIVIHSKRLDVKTIHATMHVAIYRDAPDQWWVEVHNTGRKDKIFDLRCTVKFSTLYTERNYRTGDLSIESKRTNDGYETFYGSTADIGGASFDNLISDGFQVNCNLHNDSVF